MWRSVKVALRAACCLQGPHGEGVDLMAHSEGQPAACSQPSS